MRWHVEITFRTEAGDNLVEHYVEELEEVAPIVERGPDWNTIVDIRIQLAQISSPDLTVEKSETI